MKKISTLLLATALVSPVCMSAADIVTGSVQVEFWTADVVQIDRAKYNVYNGDPNLYEPNTLMGTWTSGEKAFSYNPETGRYRIENFLNGGEKTVLEFTVGETLRDYSKVLVGEEGDQTVSNPLRYDFEVIFKNAEGVETNGLKAGDYNYYSIYPNPGTVTQANIGGWTVLTRIESTNNSDHLGPFVGEENSYSFKSGLRLSMTTPQRSETGTVNTTVPYSVDETAPEGFGEDSPSFAQLSYVVKDGDIYTIYLSIKALGVNKYYVNDDSAENAFTNSTGAVFKMSFNKNTLTAGVDEVITDTDNAPVEYYNIQGIKVENPANGLYIKRQGDKVTKVIVR